MNEADRSWIEAMLAAPGEGEEPYFFRQMRQLTDWMPGGFFIYRADGDEELLYANEAMLRLFLCDSEEELWALTGNSFRGIVHPDDLAAVEKSIQEQIADSRYDLDYVEYRIVRKDGQIRWVEDYGHFVRSEIGDLFCVFVGDATEKRALRLQRESSLLSRIEEYHQELEGLSEEHLRRLEVIEGLSVDYESIFYLDLASDTIQTYRASGRVGYQFEQDSQTRQFSGFAADYIRTWVHPEDRVLLSGVLTPEGVRRRLEGHNISDVTYRVEGEGKTEYLQLHLVNVSGGEEVTQVVLAARSVDEVIRNGIRQREVLENALRQANSAAIAKTTFLANMSHDIRTPMNAILGFTALCRKRLDDPQKVAEYLDMIEAAGQQLLGLVNAVLEIARMESGRVQLAEEECDLIGAARSVRAAMAGKAEAKGLSLTMNVSGVGHPTVRTDEEKLTHILTLFTDNAIKYTPAGGQVELLVEELSGAAVGYGAYRLSVRDTGVGIRREFMDRLFAPFEREKNTTLGGVPGTGLGLTIAKSLAELMGGVITVESEPGKGSTFAIALTLPLAGMVPPQPAAPAAGPCLTGKVLVVEDNLLNLEIQRELLESEGFRVDTAVHGREALEKVEAAAPGEYSLILMDIQMPVMDGYEAARAIRALPDPQKAGLPIIAVSANAFDEDKRLSSESGMNAHLAKPVDLEELLEAIRRVMK